MDRKVKYVQYGCGRMSRWLMRYAIEKGCDLLAAFDVNPAIVGKDVSEIIGNGYPEVGVKVSAVEEADRMCVSLRQEVQLPSWRIFLQSVQNMG